MDLLAKRETELNSIYKYSARGFLGLYLVGALGYYGLRKGSMPYFKDVTMHFIITKPTPSPFRTPIKRARTRLTERAGPAGERGEGV